MSEPFSNGLSDAEVERLGLLAEECGEAIQIIGKILRHGYESVNPYEEYNGTNRDRLTREIADILVALDFMLLNRDVLQAQLDERKKIKHHKIWDWLHHQVRVYKPDPPGNWTEP
jgi:hypothetical protein